MDIYEKIMALPVRKNLAQHVTLRKYDELDIIVIDNTFCRAAISLQGAQLLLWQPSSQKLPVLWLSEASPFKTGVPVRGGVPLCWPWFTDMGGQPHHGIARILTWQPEDIWSRPRSTQLTFSLRDTPESRRIWDRHFHLTMTFTFTEALCELTLTMQGEFEATAALHSYFYTRDVNMLTVSGLGAKGINTVTGASEDALAEPFTLRNETGVMFTHPDNQSVIHDGSASRRITLTHVNHSDVVVWNPGPQRAGVTADIPDEGWREFACVESARISHPLRCRWQEPVSLGVQLQVNRQDTEA